MNRHQRDGLRDVEGGATAKADHRVGAVRAIRIGTVAHLRRYGVALYARIHAGIQSGERAAELGEHRQRSNPLVGDDERAPATCPHQVRRNELSRPRAKVDRGRESEFVDRHISAPKAGSRAAVLTWCGRSRSRFGR
jgi:hypothetical protein